MNAALDVLSRTKNRLAAQWRAVPYLCSHCGGEIAPDTIGEGETVGWCSHCERVLELPLLKIPSWVAGAVLLLAVKVQAGF